MHSQSFSSETFFESMAKVVKTEAESIKILLIGDVIGKPGRKVLKQNLAKLREAAGIDFVVANAENLAGGFGITEGTFNEMLQMGVDCMTMGNHWYDKPDVHKLRLRPELILPHNLPDLDGVEKLKSFELPKRNKTLTVLNLMGLFGLKGPYNDPFAFIQKHEDAIRSKTKSGSHIVLVDMHAESSAEKQAVAWYLNGVVAGVVGTHTHTPTGDERILSKGTALLTDLGMTGAYESIIGMTVDRSLARYFQPTQKKPQEVAEGDVWFCSFLLEISPATGLTLQAHRLQFREELGMWSIHSCVQPLSKTK